MDEDELKASLLGLALPVRPATGGHTINPQDAFAPLRESYSVTRMFCTGCGAKMELDRDEAEGLAEMAHVAIESFAGTYFECARCVCCDDAFKAPALKRPE